MNVFWLLSTFLLWNALVVVQGRMSSEIETNGCDQPPKGSIVTLLDITDTIEPDDEERYIKKLYTVIAMLEISLGNKLINFNFDCFFISFRMSVRTAP